MKPIIEITDVATGHIEIREMTEKEYAALMESGWTPGEPEEATEE